MTLLDIYRPLVKSAYHKKYIFLDQSICFGYSEEPSQQGRRRVFKIGPAEKVIEVRRHKRGRAREGDYSPSC